MFPFLFHPEICKPLACVCMSMSYIQECFYHKWTLWDCNCNCNCNCNCDRNCNITIWFLHTFIVLLNQTFENGTICSECMCTCVHVYVCVCVCMCTWSSNVCVCLHVHVYIHVWPQIRTNVMKKNAMTHAFACMVQTSLYVHLQVYVPRQTKLVLLHFKNSAPSQMTVHDTNTTRY